MMWYFLLFLLPTVSLLFPNNETSNQTAVLAEFAVSILKNECSHCTSVIVVHSGTEPTCNIFLKHVLGSSSLYTLRVDINGTAIEMNDLESPIYKSELTLIFIDTRIIPSVESYIFSIELLPLWNVRGKFLIIKDGEQMEEEQLTEWLRETFELFWEKQVLRVLVVLLKDGEYIQEFTFNPFREEYSIEVSKDNRNVAWFKRKVTDMNGVPIKLYQFDTVLADAAVKIILPDGSETWVGRDGMFFSVLASTLNTNLMVHKLSEEFSDEVIKNSDPNLPLDHYLELFSDIFDYDILFNRMQLFSDNKLDHVLLYERNDIRVIVPKTGIVPQYLYMMMLVQAEVWGSILFTLIAVIIARKILGGKHAASVLDNVSYLLGTAAPNRQRTNSPERFLFALWMFACVILDTMFQSMLMSTLVAPKYYPDIDTIEELANTNMKIYGPEHINLRLARILLFGHDKRFMSHVHNVSREITVYGENLEWIELFREGNAVIVSQDHIYRLQKTSPLLFDTHHVLKESPMPTVQAYNMPTNKLYFPEMQHVFDIIQEAGLHLYWRKYDYFIEREIIEHNKTTITTHIQILTLFHLQSAFVILMLGLSTSLFVFCCEFIRHHTRRENQIVFMN